MTLAASSQDLAVDTMRQPIPLHVAHKVNLEFGMKPSVDPAIDACTPIYELVRLQIKNGYYPTKIDVPNNIAYHELAGRL